MSFHEREAFRRAVLDSLTAHIAVLDRTGTLVAVNQAWERFGREQGALSTPLTGVGANYLAVCQRATAEAQADAQTVALGIQSVLSGAQASFTFEYACHSFTERRWFMLSVTPLALPQGGVVVAHVDITERRLLEEKNTQLLKAIALQRTQLRTLHQHLAESQEIERKTLARELHDRVGQNLTALGINLTLIKAQALHQPPQLDRLQQYLNDAEVLVSETTEQIRDVMADLRPPMLDHYGLLATLQWYATLVTQRTNLRIIVQGAEPIPRLTEQVELTLFRIGQEALTNVIKHAQATQAIINLQQIAGLVRLTIADNGCGIDSAQLEAVNRRPSWGLLAIRERIEAVNGRHELVSHPGEGTTLIVEVFH